MQTLKQQERKFSIACEICVYGPFSSLVLQHTLSNTVLKGGAGEVEVAAGLGVNANTGRVAEIEACFHIKYHVYKTKTSKNMFRWP